MSPPTETPFSVALPVLKTLPNSLCGICARMLGLPPSPYNIPCIVCGNSCIGLNLRNEGTTDPLSQNGGQYYRPQRLKKSSELFTQTRMEDLSRTNGPLPQNGVNPDATAHRLRKWKPKTPSPPPIFVQDLSLPYIPPPKPVALPPGTADACPPVMYQSLALLLADLNKLLNTPHEDRAFHFKGACTIVADPSIGSGDRVRRVAWEVIRRTVVAFNIHALTIENGTFGALTTAQSSALWMSSPPASLAIATVPCRKCEHIFTIGAEPCVSAPTPIFTPEARVQLSGQRIMVVLRHLPT